MAGEVSEPRYTLREPLGAGGMAEVVKAWDGQLQRWVALKFLHIQHPILTERLLQEARLQARVEHPGVCRVYDAGTLDGRPYIAFQLVEGPTLDRAAEDMSLEEKVLVMRAVAEAVHAAHRTGLIHRDIKPSNILLEKDETGWRPLVTDFGLAREMAAPHLSAAGSITGTPDTMAPEQARGDQKAVDRRTDVYALGATLYHLLCGQPPFTGATAMDVLVKVLADEPPPPRSLRPSIPRDLETIVLKCLEKDPARRYESARALAEDLGRFLDGEPIAARPAGPLYRLGKRIRRNRALAAVTATALAALLVVGGLGAYAAWKARTQARLAQAFGRDLERAESILRLGRLLPLHDTGGERRLAEGILREIESRTAELGSLAEGPGNAAAGAAYLALGNPQEARLRLERAWKAGARDPETAHALGRALGELYQRELLQVQRLGSKELKEARLEEIQRVFRDPALRFLGEARKSTVQSPDYLEALLAYYEDHLDEALAHAEKARASLPWLYEADLLKGQILFRKALLRQEKGEWEAARSLAEEARKALARAREAGRSDARIYAQEGRVWILEMELLGARGMDPSGALEGALEACRQGRKAEPASGLLHNVESRACLQEAMDLANRGGEAAPYFARAVEAAERAAAADPRDAEAHRNLALAFFRMGEWASGGGKDPVPYLERAVAAASRSLELDPGDPYALNTLGLSRWRLADAALYRGEDPRPQLKLAAEAFQRALSPRPFFVYLINLGNVSLTGAIYEKDNGLDPTAALKEAAARYREAAALNPGVAQCYSNLGASLVEQAEWHLRTGASPEADLRAAEENFQKALALNPNRPAAHYNLHSCAMAEATWRMGQGEDPEPALRRAEEHLDRALALRPGYPEYLRSRAEIELFRARSLARSGGDPEPHLRKAEALLAEVLRQAPENAEGYGSLAELFRIRAEASARRGGAPGPEVRKGLQAAERALALHPGAARPLAARGVLLLRLAEGARGEERRRRAAEAGEALEAAVRRDPLQARDLEEARQRARLLAEGRAAD